MNAHAKLTGMVQGWSDDDYVVLDQNRSVGRIHKDTIQGEPRWFWSINTGPYAAPPPNRGYVKTLPEAKAAFKRRYEEMRAAGVRFGFDAGLG